MPRGKRISQGLEHDTEVNNWDLVGLQMKIMIHIAWLEKPNIKTAGKHMNQASGSNHIDLGTGAEVAHQTSGLCASI